MSAEIRPETETREPRIQLFAAGGKPKAILFSSSIDRELIIPDIPFKKVRRAVVHLLGDAIGDYSVTEGYQQVNYHYKDTLDPLSFIQLSEGLAPDEPETRISFGVLPSEEQMAFIRSLGTQLYEKPYFIPIRQWHLETIGDLAFLSYVAEHDIFDDYQGELKEAISKAVVEIRGFDRDTRRIVPLPKKLRRFIGELKRPLSVALKYDNENSEPSLSYNEGANGLTVKFSHRMFNQMSTYEKALYFMLAASVAHYEEAFVGNKVDWGNLPVCLQIYFHALIDDLPYDIDEKSEEVSQLLRQLPIIQRNKIASRMLEIHDNDPQIILDFCRKEIESAKSPTTPANSQSS